MTDSSTHLNTDSSTLCPKAKEKVKGKARPTASPYKEGKGYAIRTRYKGNDIYISGKKDATQASKAAAKRRAEIDRYGVPKGAGPERTTLAQAMQDYGMERLRFKKGAVQEAVRINHYLRAAHLATLVVLPLQPQLPLSEQVPKSTKEKAKEKKVANVYFEVKLQPYTSTRVIANGLQAHRAAQLTKTAGSQKHRAVLASKVMGEIMRRDVQGYMDAMRDERSAPASMALERALIRALFNHAKNGWSWASLEDNPATGLTMPAIDNERKRRMSMQEQELLDAAMAECRNQLIAPASALLRETAMRSSEPLRMACWQDIDWERKVLTLRDAKAGAREVPLSPAALQALKELCKIAPSQPDDPVLNISYESLRAAWTRACARADIKNLKIHDLRATGATRMALKTGNRFFVKVLTGHKTDHMVDRYICVDADDVVKVMHAPEVPDVPDAATARAPSDATDGAALAPLAPGVSTGMFQDAVALAVQKVLEQMQGANTAAPIQQTMAQSVDAPCPPPDTDENSHAHGAGLPQELSATQSTSHQAEQGDDAPLHDVCNAAPKSNVVQFLRPPKAQKKAGSVKRGTPSALS